MPTVADTRQLVQDGVLSPEQATEIESRARGLMVNLGVNAVLCFGIIAATLGLIFWLADALAVALTGMVLLGAGLLVLRKGSDLHRMFGNASALIGAGMLIGGAFVELVDKYEDIAGWASALMGAGIAALAYRSFAKGGLTTRFVSGSIFLMGVALHLAGILVQMDHAEISGWPVAMIYGYSAIAIAIAGWIVDVRLVTALAIVPFAQMLDTSTSYFHAAYVFYSPESTLSILQMAMLIGGCVWVMGRYGDRTARHAGILGIMAFIVANLSALVGSLWGDVVGSHTWGPGAMSYKAFEDWEAYRAANDAFKATAIVISEHVYSAVWALALIAIAFWAAHTGRRGLFNTAVTFGAIHAYTQAFETFYDEPLAYVIGGFAAIPLAWGMWRLNQSFLTRQAQETRQNTGSEPGV